MKNKIATISQLQTIPYRENKQALVNLEKFNPSILSAYRRMDTGIRQVLVRESVAIKLQRIQKQLSPHMQLLVVEGYRPFTYQEEYYLKELLAQLTQNPTCTLPHLLEKTHQFVALPSVAGHPTGGAVDLTISIDGKEVDMGGEIADFSSPQLLPTYSRCITQEQAKWRMILHDLMIAEGFAPFYGEWWHFSYGDREWASFYEQQEAIFPPVFSHKFFYPSSCY